MEGPAFASQSGQPAGLVSAESVGPESVPSGAQGAPVGRALAATVKVAVSGWCPRTSGYGKPPCGASTRAGPGRRSGRAPQGMDVGGAQRTTARPVSWMLRDDVPT